MTKIAYAALFLLLFASAAAASDTPVAVPEIDASTVAAGIAVITGAVFMVRSRRKH